MIDFDPECQAAIALAKRLRVDEDPLQAAHLIPALFLAPSLRPTLDRWSRRVPEPKPLREPVPGTVATAESLRSLFTRMSEWARPVRAVDLLLELAGSPTGMDYLASCGLGREEIGALCAALGEAPRSPAASPVPARSASPASTGARSWRDSPERQEAVRQLSSFGRMLTLGDLPERQVKGRDEVLHQLFQALSQQTKRNAILVGPPGTGKTAIVYELARRLVRGDVPPLLRDLDLFELSPTFLRSGASLVGQYEERVKTLLEVLRKCPKIVLFVDEIHSLLQSGVHDRSTFSDANEAFKAALGKGELSCIGCTTLAEYRRFIEPDPALVRRFGLVTLSPPTAQETIRILEARRPRIEAYYAPLRVPDIVIRKAVALADDYLPSRFQPDKSIQLLDRACASCAIADKPPAEVTEEALHGALGAILGYAPRLGRSFTEEEVYRFLTRKIVGQDQVLRDIAQAWVAGLGSWRKESGPRGVFLFGGPTGVGKTETATLLAELLGNGRQAMVRVDCSTLQGAGLDSGPSINRLLGVPPGYVGYARGQGGLLSRVRDLPDSVVLFDEFEKADPGVGELMLRILDEGRLEDVDGNLLDFRRSFIIFTSNAGSAYERPKTLGFPAGHHDEGPARPSVDATALWRELRAMGLREEFQGRIQHLFLFQGLDPFIVPLLIERQLENLKEAAQQKSFALTWEEGLVAHVAAQWQPRWGVRHLSAILRNRVVGQLSSAEAAGDLKGVSKIHLSVLPAPTGNAPVASAARRERVDDTLQIALA